VTDSTINGPESASKRPRKVLSGLTGTTTSSVDHGCGGSMDRPISIIHDRKISDIRVVVTVDQTRRTVRYGSRCAVNRRTSTYRETEYATGNSTPRLHVIFTHRSIRYFRIHSRACLPCAVTLSMIRFEVAGTRTDREDAYTRSYLSSSDPITDSPPQNYIVILVISFAVEQAETPRTHDSRSGHPLPASPIRG